MHTIFRALLEFSGKHGGLPHLNNEKEANEVYLIACENAKKIIESEIEEEDVVKVKEVDKELCYNVARYARAQISPIASFLGGIIA